MRVKLVAAKLARAVLEPTAPENVNVPFPPAIIRLSGPSSVEPNVTLALLDVIVLAAIMLTGSVKFKVFAPVTVMLLPT